MHFWHSPKLTSVVFEAQAVKLLHSRMSINKCIVSCNECHWHWHFSNHLMYSAFFWFIFPLATKSMTKPWHLVVWNIFFRKPWSRSFRDDFTFDTLGMTSEKISKHSPFFSLAYLNFFRWKQQKSQSLRSKTRAKIWAESPRSQRAHWSSKHEIAFFRLLFTAGKLSSLK